MLTLCSKLRPHFKGFCSSPSVIMLFVDMKCRFSLSYRDLEEMMMIREDNINHSTLRRWVKRFVSLIDKRICQRKKQFHGSWCMDETYTKLNKNWVYLYRAVDKEENTIDFLLRAKRNAGAAKVFLQRLIRKMAGLTKLLLIRAGAIGPLLTILIRMFQKRKRLKIDKSNISITLSSKIIGLSRNEPGRHQTFLHPDY